MLKVRPIAYPNMLFYCALNKYKHKHYLYLEHNYYITVHLTLQKVNQLIFWESIGKKNVMGKNGGKCFTKHFVNVLSNGNWSMVSNIIIISITKCWYSFVPLHIHLSHFHVFICQNRKSLLKMSVYCSKKTGPSCTSQLLFGCKYQQVKKTSFDLVV